PFARRSGRVASLLGPGQRRLGGAPARLERLLERTQAALDRRRRTRRALRALRSGTGRPAARRGRDQLTDGELRLPEGEQHVDSAEQLLERASADVLNVATEGLVGHRGTPCDEPDQGGDRQQGRKDLELDPHVLPPSPVNLAGGQPGDDAQRAASSLLWRRTGRRRSAWASCTWPPSTARSPIAAVPPRAPSAATAAPGCS